MDMKLFLMIVAASLVSHVIWDVVKWYGGQLWDLIWAAQVSREPKGVRPLYPVPPPPAVHMAPGVDDDLYQEPVVTERES